MKKRLVAYLMVSALAVTVLAGCGSKGDAAGDAADAATGEAAVEEDAFVEEDDASAALTAAIEEAAAVADTGDAVAAVADTAADAAEEYVDDEVIADADATTAAAAVAEDVAEKVEEFVVNPGEYYTVLWGGNVYATPDESTPVIDQVIPDWQLLITERLDNYWYKVSYQILGENEPRTGYIKIQH